jgi:hypothetical protein
MKTKLSTIKRLLLVVCCMVVSHVSWAQNPTYELVIHNETLVNPTTYEFDLSIVRTGTTPLEIANIGIGIGVDISVINGGTVTASAVSGTSEMVTAQVPNAPSFTAGTLAVGGVTYRYISFAARANPGAGAGTVVSSARTGCTSVGTRIYRVRLSNTVAWAANSTCKHVFTTAPGSGRANTLVSAYVGGVASNVTVTASHKAFNVSGTCITQPNGIPLTAAPVCTAPVLSAVPTAPSCVGLSEGSINLTATGGSPAPTFAWTKVGGGFNASTEDISGLSAGDYTVIATSGTCTSTATYTVAAGPAVNVTTVTVNSCGSYTWPVTGQTYSTSGTYPGPVVNCAQQSLELTITSPPALPTLACYQTATLNTATCTWDVTGTQPAMPTLACYETASFNNTTCSWDVSGTQPAMPTLACYETASLNNSTCAWVVSGTQPAMPTLACYETASFNNSTCQWVVSGTQPAMPTLACYETASFNNSTCAW